MFGASVFELGFPTLCLILAFSFFALPSVSKKWPPVNLLLVAPAIADKPILKVTEVP